MPVSEKTVTSFTDLGVVGAALLIVLVVIILMFVLQTTTVNKLISKVDQLITLNQTYLTTADKDNKAIIRILTHIQGLSEDTNKKVVRIDDRTYFCLGSKTIKSDVKEKEVER